MAADKPGEPTPLVQPPRRPEIIIRWEGEGLSGFVASAPLVTPAQLYSAAFYLAELARLTFIGEIQQKAAGGLVVPPPGGGMPPRRT